MKILFVVGGYPPELDGVADYTFNLAQHLRQQADCEAVRVITRKCNARDDQASELIDEVEKWNWNSVQKVIKIVRDWQPDVVNIQYPSAPFGRSLSVTILPYLLRLFCRKTSVVSTIHEFTGHTRVGKARLLFSMAPCHKIIVVNTEYIEPVRRVSSALARKLYYIPTGSNITRIPMSPVRLHEIRHELGWADSDIVIAHFGILREGKGLDDLFTAFEALVSEDPRLRLLLIGGAGPKWPESETCQRMASIQPETAIHVSGKVSETRVSELLGIADFAVLPYDDGVSTKRSTYMAALIHGLPVITTMPSSGQKNEFVSEGLKLVPVGEPQALIDAMGEFINIPEIREQYKEAVCSLSSKYNWTNIVRKVGILYASCHHPVTKQEEK